MDNIIYLLFPLYYICLIIFLLKCNKNNQSKINYKNELVETENIKL